MRVLDPSQRLAFTDALRPPSGFVLSAGFGTAFSLDFEAFTAVMLAFVGAESEEDRVDAASVLTALARLRNRLRVVVNAGSLHAPDSPSRLFALYDRVLRPVRFDHSAFHPKVWVLKFDPMSRPESRGLVPIYRVLCGSRNVTDSHCWELGAIFEGTRGKADSFGAEVSSFLRKVAKKIDCPSSVWQMVSELPTVEFRRTKETAQNLEFLWQWPNSNLLGSRLPGRADRVLLISPFVRTQFLLPLCSRTDQLTIVSTQEELDALPDHVHKQLESASVYVVTGNASVDVPGLDLHAKMLVWEAGNRSGTLVGSANATGAAWGMNATVNCEAMVALEPGLRQTDVFRSFVEPEKGELRGWIEPYCRSTPEITDEDRAQRGLDDLHRILAKLDISGTHNAAEGVLVLRGEHGPEVLNQLSREVEVEIVPLLRSDDCASWQPLSMVFAGGARFANISLAELSAFAIVRLRNTSIDVERRFGLQFSLPLAPEVAEGRDNAVHARLLEGLDPHTLLLNVLKGLPSGSGDLRTDRNGTDKKFQEFFLKRATIERVLEACTADPSRIDEVDVLLKAYQGKPSLESFRAFWSEFKLALREDRRV